jgi:hypothetical protein
MVLKNEKKKVQTIGSHDSLHTHLKPNYYSMYGND